MNPSKTMLKIPSKTLVLLLLTLFFFISSACSHCNSSASVDLQDKKEKDNGMDLYNNSRYGGNNVIARRSTIASGRASGGGSGSRSGSGSGSRTGSENGGGGSTSPRTPGGAAVIPVYGAAGAANNNKGHHNAGNRSHGSMGVITALSASILLSLFIVCLV